MASPIVLGVRVIFPWFSPFSPGFSHGFQAIGQKGFDPAATARGRRILQRLGLGKSWRLDDRETATRMGFEDPRTRATSDSVAEKKWLNELWFMVYRWFTY